MDRKIIIAEDHPFMIRSIRAICSSEGIVQLDEVYSCERLMEKLQTGAYTHLILDLTLADGDVLPLLPTIKKDFPVLKVLVYTSSPAGLYLDNLQWKYDYPCISKSEKEPKAKNKMLEFLQDIPIRWQVDLRKKESPFTVLTQREKEILKSLMMGLSPKKIGKKMNIDPTTVRVQKMNILKKTKTQNLIELKALVDIHGI